EAQLSPEDTNGERDVYVRNVAANTTALATPGLSIGAESRFDLSGDGQWITFSTQDSLLAADGNAHSDVYRRHLASGTTDLVSVNSGGAAAANGASQGPSISDDGRWVAFASRATDIIAGFTEGAGAFDSDVYV